MALNAGNSACTSGLSGRIYDQWVADVTAGFSSPLTTPQQNMIKAQCWAVAQSVVNEFNANATAAAVGDITTVDAFDFASNIALSNATKATVNALLAHLRTAGLLAP